MTSDRHDSGESGPAPAREEPEQAGEEPEQQGAAASGSGDAAEPPPADFDPAEHSSNPDLVAGDEHPDR